MGQTHQAETWVLLIDPPRLVKSAKSIHVGGSRSGSNAEVRLHAYTPARLLTGLLTLLEARFGDGQEERALEIVLLAMRANGLFLAIDLCGWQDVAPNLLGSLCSHSSVTGPARIAWSQVECSIAG